LVEINNGPSNLRATLLCLLTLLFSR